MATLFVTKQRRSSLRQVHFFLSAPRIKSIFVAQPTSKLRWTEPPPVQPFWELNETFSNSIKKCYSFCGMISIWNRKRLSSPKASAFLVESERCE
jgi:hypothetical protein